MFRFAEAPPDSDEDPNCLRRSSVQQHVAEMLPDGRFVGHRRRSSGEIGATVLLASDKQAFRPTEQLLNNESTNDENGSLSPSFKGKQSVKLGTDNGGRRASLATKLKGIDSRRMSRRPSLTGLALARMVDDDEDEAEKATDRNTCFVVHPYSEVRFYWDIILLVFMAYSSIVLPLQFGDLVEDNIGILVVDQVTNSVFLLDLLINFRTGYLDIKLRTVVLDPSLMAKKYLLTYFFPDFLATIPWDLVVIGCGATCRTNSTLLWLLKYLRVIRMIRLLRLTRILARLQVRVGLRQALSTAMFFGLGGLLMAHLSACLWYTLGMHAGQGKVGWIAKNDPKGEWGPGDACTPLDDRMRNFLQAHSSICTSRLTLKACCCTRVRRCCRGLLELHDDEHDWLRRHHSRNDS